MRALCIAAVAWISLGSPSATLAEDRERARMLFQQAAEAREQGSWDDARALLEQAVDAYPNFSIGWNLVTACERTSDLAEAERVLVWMREGGVGELSDEERRSIADRLDDLSPRLATLIVLAPDAHDGIDIDGVRHVALDASGAARVRVNPGSHELGMRTRDGGRIERTVEVRAGGTLRVRLEPPLVTAPGGVSDPAPSPTEDSGSTLWESPWLWVVVGAVILAGAGIAVIALTDREANPAAGDFTARGL